MTTTAPPVQDSRPILAVLCGELPPYRIHWHRRIAAEVTELRLRTLLYPHRIPSSWPLPTDPALGLIPFIPQRPPNAHTVDYLRLHSLRKGQWKDAGLRFKTFRAERRANRELFVWLDANRPAAMLINGHQPEPATSVILWCHRRGVPSFVWADSNVHDDHLHGWKKRVKRFALERVLGKVSVLLPCGLNGRRYFGQYCDRPMFNCPLEPDYAEIDATTPAEVEAVRVRFGLDPARKRLIVVCRLIPLKRVDTLIDAFARVSNDFPGWDLLIVGDGVSRAGLEARVPAAIKSRINWTGFISDQRTVNALYRNADVMVLPSEREAWALVVNEAAAAGLACVVSNIVGAAPELVKEHVNGRTFPPGNVDALTDCLRDVMRPDRLEAMKAASPRVVAEFRRDSDPIAGLRSALALTGVLPVRR